MKRSRTSTTSDADSEVRSDEYGKKGLRHYAGVGWIVLIGLCLVAIVAAALIVGYDRGANDPQLNAAFYGIVFVLGLLALGLLYVLFTLRGALASVRTQAIEARRVTYVRPTPAPEPMTPAPAIEYGRSSRDVEIIEGIGSVFSRRLARHDIRTLDDLRGADVQDIANAAQVSPSTAERWQSMAQIMKAHDIDAQAAELIVQSGVTSLEALADESAASLLRRARQVNGSHDARIYPDEITLEKVESWIRAAGDEAMPGTEYAPRFASGDTATA